MDTESTSPAPLNAKALVAGSPSKLSLLLLLLSHAKDAAALLAAVRKFVADAQSKNIDAAGDDIKALVDLCVPLVKDYLATQPAPADPTPSSGSDSDPAIGPVAAAQLSGEDDPAFAQALAECDAKMALLDGHLLNGIKDILTNPTVQQVLFTLLGLLLHL